MKFDLYTQRQLDAAEGWLGLGDWVEASEELKQIRPELGTHPVVLQVQWNIYAQAKQWESAAALAAGLARTLPDDSWGCIHWAYGLHELKRTEEARTVLLPCADKFPDQYLIRYNLACYECQLGNLAKAWLWLEQAMTLAGRKPVRKMALEDSDLKPLWEQIRQS
jgi:predicted Zn-dependent protease